MENENKPPQPVVDIPHAWQKRRDELAQLLRDCKHDGRVLVNDQGEMFCERCGLKLPCG